MLANASDLHRTVVIFSVFCALSAHAREFAGGTGEPNDPYQIATVAQLISIGSDPNLLDKHFVLVNDIDLDPNLPGGRIFTRAVIAAAAEDESRLQDKAFSGSLDGRGHTIRNLVISEESLSFTGLFDCIGERGIVRDLEIDAAKMETYCAAAGILAGRNAGRVVNCRVAGHISAIWGSLGSVEAGGLIGHNMGDIVGCQANVDRIWAYAGAGGLVGHNGYDGNIVGCRATCKDVHAWKFYAGGLAGINDGYIGRSCATGSLCGWYFSYCYGGLAGNSSGTIINCYADVAIGIDGGGSGFGGLVGRAVGTLINCYATGRIVTGDRCSDVGGLVGHISYGCVLDSYAIGQISTGANNERVGGLIGDAGDSSVRMSFWDVETSGIPESAAGTGLTTLALQDPNTFLAAGWDFVGERANGTGDVWLLPQPGAYPTLALLSDTYNPPRLAGSGTSDDPYRIGTPEDLGAVWHHDPSACYKMTANIGLTDIVWPMAPIGYFNGTFDGAGYLISHLTISGQERLGLFGSLTARATVKNLGIEDANITGGDGARYLGILAGHNEGDVAGCYSRGHICAGDASGYLGGLVGESGAGSTIVNSYSMGIIVSGDHARGLGGLVGRSYQSRIANCYAVVSVRGGAGSSHAGGLVGYVDGHLGEGSGVTYSFWDSEVSSLPANSAGTGLATSQMRTGATFINAGWDLDNAWMICEGDYPHLQWEKIDCAQP